MPTNKEWNIIKWTNAYKKSKDIAYFNSLNAAIKMITFQTPRTEEETEASEKFIIMWRDFFFKEWHKWWKRENPKPQFLPKSEIEEKLAQEYKVDAVNEETERLEQINLLDQ